MIEIYTENLLIRNHKESDWEDLYEYLSLEEIYTYEPGGPISIEDSKSIIKERSKESKFLAVVLRSSSKMIGHLYFNQLDPKHFMTWELGYIFNPKYQGEGYCSEASLAISKYAFNELNAHKITAYSNIKNTASWKVLEKIGMDREGLIKQKGFFRKDKDGNPLWNDCYLYGLLGVKFT